jgi:hypothetical protein
VRVRAGGSEAQQALTNALGHKAEQLLETAVEADAAAAGAEPNDEEEQEATLRLDFLSVSAALAAKATFEALDSVASAEYVVEPVTEPALLEPAAPDADAELAEGAAAIRIDDALGAEPDANPVDA